MKGILRIQTGFLSLLFAWVFITESSGQDPVLNKDGTIDCTEPTLIEVTREGILMISSDEYRAVSMVDDHIVFYKESDQYTFWYKLVIDYTCDLQFNLQPSDKSDFYNSYIYNYHGDNFCRAVIDKTLIPYATNQYEQISPVLETEMDRTRKEERIEPLEDDNYLLYKPMQRVIKAQKGQVYYVNVHHFVGQDCGHMIEFSSCEKSLIVEARHKPCFEPSMNLDPLLEVEEQLESIPSVASISSNPLEELIVQDVAVEQMNPDVPDADLKSKTSLTRKIELKPIAIDERTNKTLHADIEIYETNTGIAIDHLVTVDGVIEAELLLDTDYTIKYSSLGYESKNIDMAEMIDEDKLSHSSVSLEPKSVGTAIVLNNIYFHPNTHVFRNGANGELDRLLNFLMDNQDARIEIQGHTNGDYRVKPKARYSHLGDAWNFQGSSKKLSKLRAGEVRDYLTTKGIDEARLTIIGLGGEHMIIPDPDDYEDRLVNMRVEIVIREI